MTLNLFDSVEDAAVLSRRERKKHNQKHTIIKAAITLFEKSGYDSTSVADIATEANVAYATVFKYFPTKLGLLLYMNEVEYEDLTEVLALRFSETTPIQDILYGVCSEWVTDSLKMRKVYVRMQEATMLNNMEPRLTKIEELLKTLIERGIKNNYFKNDIDAELYAVLLSGLRCKVFQNNRPDLFDSGFQAIMQLMLK